MWMATVADAGGLVWSWSADAPQRYLMEVQVQTPVAMVLLHERNLEVRTADIGVQFVTTCRLGEVLPMNRGWDVVCGIEDARVFTKARTRGAARAQPIVEQDEQWLEGASLEFEFSYHGHVTAIDLLGERTTPRERAIHEMLNRLVGRAACVFDVALPQAQPEGGRWAHKPYRFAESPLASATPGLVNATQAYGTRSGDRQTLVVNAGGSIEVAGQMWEVTVSGKSVFDLKEGVLTKNAIQRISKPGDNTVGTNNLPLAMVAKMSRLPANLEVKLDPSTSE